MADFLTTNGTTTCIEELITKAKSRIVLISPYLKWSQILFERLVEADRRSSTAHVLRRFGAESSMRRRLWLAGPSGGPFPIPRAADS